MTRAEAAGAGADSDEDEDLTALLRQQQEFLKDKSTAAATAHRVPGPTGAVPARGAGSSGHVAETRGGNNARPFAGGSGGAQEGATDDGGDPGEPTSVSAAAIIGRIVEHSPSARTRDARVPFPTASGDPAVRGFPAVPAVAGLRQDVLYASPTATGGGQQPRSPKTESVFARQRRLKQEQTRRMQQEDGSSAGAGSEGTRPQPAHLSARPEPSRAAGAGSGGKRMVGGIDMAQIDADNAEVVQNMSAADIKQAQEEIFESMTPGALKALRRRAERRQQQQQQQQQEPQLDSRASKGVELGGTEPSGATSPRPPSVWPEDEVLAATCTGPYEAAKLEWTRPVDTGDEHSSLYVYGRQSENQPGPQDAQVGDGDDADRLLRNLAKEEAQRVGVEDPNAIVRTMTRFGFDGAIIAAGVAVPEHLGLHHHAAELSDAGYTLRELVHLVRSQVASQRLMALNTLAEIIRKSGPANDGTGGVGAPGDAEAGPVPTVIGAMLELHVPLFLRKAMDDHVAQVMVSAIRALVALMHHFSGLDSADQERQTGGGLWVGFDDLAFDA